MVTKPKRVKEPWQMTANEYYGFEYKGEKFESSSGEEWLAIKLKGGNPFITPTRGEWHASGKLADIIIADNIFRKYPKLRDIKTKISIDPSRSTDQAVTYWNSKANLIVGIEVLATKPQEAKRLLAHEIDHAVQILSGIKPDYTSSGVPAEWLYPERMDKYMKSKTELSAYATDHKKIVSKALREGKWVPQKVLAEYPDLLKRNKK